MAEAAQEWRGSEVVAKSSRNVDVEICSRNEQQIECHLYERLAAEKREGESFSKAINRLLEEVGAAHTGGDIVRGLEAISALDDQHAEIMLAVIRENRESEVWEEHDLR